MKEEIDPMLPIVDKPEKGPAKVPGRFNQPLETGEQEALLPTGIKKKTQ